MIGASAALWAAAWLYAPWALAGPTLCPLRLVLGLPCPACGLTRAFCRLAHGDLPGALAFNALCLPLGLLLIAAPATALAELARGHRAGWYVGLLFSPRLARAAGLAVAAYHLARCGLWLWDGTLAREYLAPSLFGRLFRLAAG